MRSPLSTEDLKGGERTTTHRVTHHVVRAGGSGTDRYACATPDIPPLFPGHFEKGA